MGTVVHVQPGKYVKQVKETFERVDAEMSEWKSNSPLSQVNKSAGKAGVVCPNEVVEAVQQALSIAKLTQGAFDPTWASMWHLWDFTSGRFPSEIEVARLLPLVNWKKVVVTNNTVLLENADMLLGLGGIAKGVALNDSRDALLAEGVQNFMLQVGGQVLVHGGERVVGIRNPIGHAYEVVGTVMLKDTSISTSGNYEKYFIEDGVRYHHIIDPSTGFPTRGTKSVSVIAEDAALADALSTALMVMGVKEGLVLVEKLQGIEALFIDEAMKIHRSTSFHLEIPAS